MSTIGLDLTVVQTPHRMRGIGATAINFINNIGKEVARDYRFVFYLYPESQAKALELFNLSNLDYEVRTIPHTEVKVLPLPGKLRLFNGLWRTLVGIRRLSSGDPRLKNETDLDAFIQFDQVGPLPRSRKIKKVRVIYDLIPYVMANDYLWTYKIGRTHGDSRKSSLRKSTHRKMYRIKNRAAAKQADTLIAISEHTKQDYVKYLGIKAKKIDVVHLGVTNLNPTKTNGHEAFTHLVENSWGYLPQPIDLNKAPFILFVGGVDPRRKIKHLVAAYNMLRAQGKDIRLVLAGDSMNGAKNIPIKETRDSVLKSSYRDGIIFLGFVTDAQKEWLYRNALVMVYPSVYEGFGLPVLEAMKYGTPVITYSNTSIREVAGDAAIYAHDAATIASAILNLSSDKAEQDDYRHKAIEQADQFPWEKTVNAIIDRC